MVVAIAKGWEAGRVGGKAGCESRMMGFIAVRHFEMTRWVRECGWRQVTKVEMRMAMQRAQVAMVVCGKRRGSDCRFTRLTLHFRGYCLHFANLLAMMHITL